MADNADRTFFGAWGRIVLKYRWLWLLLVAAATAGMVKVTVDDLRVENSFEIFTPAGSPERVALDEYRTNFGQNDVFVVLVEGDVFTEPFLRRLAALHHALEELPVEGVRSIADDPPAVDLSSPAPGEDDFEDMDDGSWDDGEDAPTGGEGAQGEGTVVDEVISLINVRRVRHSEQGLTVGKLLDPMPVPEALPVVRAEVMADRTLVGQVVSRDGRIAVIALRTVRITEDDASHVYEVIRDLCQEHEEEGFAIEVTGMPAINAALNAMVIEDISRLPAIALFMMLVAMFLLFRHPVGTIGPVLVVVLAIVWTMGFMAMTHMTMNILSSILPAFLTVVGIGDSVHLQSVYRDCRRRGLSNEAAIVRACAVTGPPVFYTSVTTMIGLLSLRFASTSGIIEMGTAGGFGVMVALLHSLVVLPILLTFNRKSLLGARADGGSDRIDRVLDWMVGLSDNTRGRGRLRGVAVGAVALIVVAGFGISLIEVWHDDLSTVPEDAEVRRNVQLMDRRVAGVSTIQLIVDPVGELGMKDLELLRGLEALEAHMLAYVDPADGVRILEHAISLLDVIKESRRALLGDDPADYRLPDVQGDVQDLLFLFESSGPNELRRLTTVDLSLSHMTFSVRWREATSYRPLMDHLRTGVERHLAGKAEIRATGSAPLGHLIVSVLLADLLKSFGTAFLFITVIMVFMLRDVKLGLLAMVPNLVPIAFVLGGMGLLGIPVDLNNLLIASIALGIAVDDTIHFLHHFKIGFQSTGDVEEGIAAAMHHAGRAMFSTSILLTMGFIVYGAAMNVAVQRFGLLTSATVLIAFAVDLIIGPALLRIAYRTRQPA